MLYNHFINDLFLFVENSDICNFADDNILSLADLSTEYIIRLEHDIEILLWYLNNRMLLNESQCQFLIIESTKSKRNNIVEIEIHNKKNMSKQKKENI